MYITAVKNKGETVASDSDSVSPPLCQILNSLCSACSWLMQSSVVSALGTIQIMVGLFNIGLGPGRTSLHPGDFTHLKAAYWLGGVYIAVGFASIYADCLYLVGFAVFMNIIGSIVAIVGIVLYAIDLGDGSVASMCDWNSYNVHSYDDNCRHVAYFAQRLLTAMDITMIVLTVLQLCVCVSLAIMGINALHNRKKDEQGDKDVEINPPLLTGVLMTSPGA